MAHGTMHIVMISDVFFPRVNGVSTSIATFRQDLEALGHRVTLVAPAYPAGAWSPDEDVERVPSRYLVVDPEDRMMRWGALKRIEADLAAREPDVVHVQTPFMAHYFGRRLAARAGCPLVESYHTFFEQYLYHYLPWVPGAWLRRAARTLSRRQCNAVDRVVVPSAAMRDVLRRYGVRPPIDIVPTGLSPEAFTPGDGTRFRREHDIPIDRPLLLHVGRLAHEKNIRFLIEMLPRVRAAVPDVLLLIAGEGPAEQDLRQLVWRRGLTEQVAFTGYLDRRVGLKDCYRAADAFVFASRTETQGLVLLEALAQGTPVVSTAVMGTRGIVEPARGAIPVAEDREAFADAVAALLGDGERRARMADEARAFARSWSARAMAQKLLGSYRAAGTLPAAACPVA